MEKDEKDLKKLLEIVLEEIPITEKIFQDLIDIYKEAEMSASIQGKKERISKFESVIVLINKMSDIRSGLTNAND